MTLREHIRTHRKWKQNPAEHALQGPVRPRAAAQIENLREFCDFLKSKNEITNLNLVTNIICNQFFTGTDAYGRRLFIKTGKHAGIYENEYRMGHMLYDIDKDHFIEPLYYSDYGKFKFFSNEYTDGVTLKTAVMTGRLDDAAKSKIISDIWRIFCALRASDVVHRDVRPDNLMITNGRLVLIDFQLAVLKSNYVELEYLARRPNRLRKLGNKHFRYHPFTWDDAYSLLKVMEFVGRSKYYGQRYDIIYKNIKSYVGTDKVRASVREGNLHRITRHIKTLRI